MPLKRLRELCDFDIRQFFAFDRFLFDRLISRGGQAF
jgi:hypothetical protein